MLNHDTPRPPVADVLDSLNDCARNLADLIREANSKGVLVRIEPAPAGASSIFNLIYGY